MLHKETSNCIQSFLMRSLLRFFAASIFCGAAHAGYGLNDYGYGVESVGMAGADIALAREPSAQNVNPAGMTHAKNRGMDLYLETAYYSRVSHRDEFGSDVDVADLIIAIFSGGCVHRLRGTSVVLAVGLFFQGESALLTTICKQRSAQEMMRRPSSACRKLRRRSLRSRARDSALAAQQGVLTRQRGRNFFRRHQ